jgi:hypothetical protein
MTADLDGLPFAIVRRGFDRAQVEERLSKLLSERDSAHTARQNAVADRERISRELDVSRGETRAARSELAETRAEVDRLAGQVAELSTIPNTVDGMSDRLQQMVRVAQDEVNDMRSRATRGAAQILSMAQAEADELRESARHERRTFESEQRSAQDELHARLEETRTQLAALREEADGQRARLDAELAERRARDEQTLAAELADRREVMLADLASQEKRQREEAQRIVDAASARARALVADAAADTDRARSHAREQVIRANDELEQLRALQHQVAEQLAGVRSLLDWTLPRINPAVGPASGEAPVSLSAIPPVSDGGDPLAVGSAAPPVATVPELAGLDDRSPGGGLDDERDVAYGNHGHGDASDLDGLDSPVYDTTVFHAQGFDQGFDGARAGEVSGRDDDLDDGGLHDGDLDDGDLDDGGLRDGGLDGRGRDEPVAERSVLTPSRGTGIPQQRDDEQVEVAGRPSPVARSGHRAGSRR